MIHGSQVFVCVLNIFLGYLASHRRFMMGSVSAAASQDHHVEVRNPWLILCSRSWYLSWQTRISVSAQSLPRKYFPSFVQSLSSDTKISLWTQFQSNSARVFPLIFWVIFCYFDLFVVPHTLLLPAQLPAPMAMVQYFSPYSSIKCSISPVKPFLGKAWSLWPLINMYF